MAATMAMFHCPDGTAGTGFAPASCIRAVFGGVHDAISSKVSIPKAENAAYHREKSVWPTTLRNELAMAGPMIAASTPPATTHEMARALASGGRSSTAENR